MPGSLKEKGQRPSEEFRPSTDEVGEKGESSGGYQNREVPSKGGTKGEETEDGTAMKEVGDLEADHDVDTEAGSHSGDSHSSDDHPISRTTTAQSRALIIVPRSKRRGLFARFSLVPEVERPYDYKNSTKWFITLMVALAGAAAPFGSSVFYRMAAIPAVP